MARRDARPTGEAFAALPVAVDAMGGDRAPAEIVAGARQVVEQAGIDVILVGRTGDMGDTGDLPCIAASEVIGMDDDPGQGVRRKKDSSLVRAAEAVRDGRGHGHGVGGQHRGHHGVGPAADGEAARGHPTGHRHSGPQSRTFVADRPARRRGQRRVHGPHARAVRPDGGGLHPQALRGGPAQGRPAVDRRGEVEGVPAGQGGPCAAGREGRLPRVRLRRQCRGSGFLRQVQPMWS